MIRVGARAPAPPPIPSPKPRLTLNGDHVAGGRLVKVRQSGDLRDRVVQLARRKEEKCENQKPTADRSRDRSYAQQAHHDRNHQVNTGGDKQVTVIVYDLHKGNATTKVTLVRPAHGAGHKDLLTANLHERDEDRKWNRITLAERGPNTDHRNASQNHPPLPRSAANRFRHTKPAIPEVTVDPSPPPSPHPADRQRHAGQGRKVTIRSLRTPTKIVINQQPTDDAEDRRQGVNSNDSSPRQSSENSKQPSTQSSVPRRLQRPPDNNRLRRQDSPRQSSEGSCQQTSSPHENASPHPPSQAPPPDGQGQGFNYRRAARVLNSAHTPAPPSQEPIKRVRGPLTQERRGPRPKSVKFRAEECSSHYQSTESPGDSPTQTARAGDVAQCEVIGNALHSQHQHSPLTSPRRHDGSKLANSFSASLEMFKRRLKLNQGRFLKDEGQVPDDEDYVIRLGDTKSPDVDAHVTHYDASTHVCDAHRNLSDHRLPDRRSQHSSGDDVRDSDLELRDGGLEGENKSGSDQRHLYKLSESTEDLPFMSLKEPVRTPLPKVKTYVVEEDSKRIQGRSLDKPAALTQHNIDLHNTLLQRKADKERARAERAERERRATGGVVLAGTAMDESLEKNSRMKRWLLDTEHQRDFQPMEINFKIALTSQ